MQQRSREKRLVALTNEIACISVLLSIAKKTNTTIQAHLYNVFHRFFILMLRLIRFQCVAVFIFEINLQALLVVIIVVSA